MGLYGTKKYVIQITEFYCKIYAIQSPSSFSDHQGSLRAHGIRFVPSRPAPVFTVMDTITSPETKLNDNIAKNK